MSIFSTIKNLFMGQQKQKGQWRLQNEEYMQKLAQDPEVKTLGAGVYYKVIETGTGDKNPQQFSVVTCHYRGSLINGKVFDSSFERNCPEAFRCRDLIPGFTLALLHMKVGDHWTVYIPQEQGYGTRNSGPIPGFSTLIFEIQLISIA